jgi:23S rRNA pseudouridine1911/1915/1917 synthase
VAAEWAGSRLDVWLAHVLDVPRSYARELLGLGKIARAAGPAAAGVRLAAQESIEVRPFRHPQEGVLPDPDAALHVLAERDGWIAVDKPAGVPAHPRHFEERGTVVNAFVARWPQALAVGDGGLYPGLVHRLDPGTSGVLLFATEASAFARARASFAERSAQKRYVARVGGVLRLSRPREVRLQLASRGERVRAVREGGREAVTILERSTVQGETSLVEIAIRTGVRHQIRATLAHLGHPVIGDATYGGAPGPRLALHAARLRIGDFTADSPVPAEL